MILIIAINTCPEQKRQAPHVDMLGECKEVEFLLKHSLCIALNLNYFERNTVALSHPTTRHPSRLQSFVRLF
jgi:hypothetical protein